MRMLPEVRVAQIFSGDVAKQTAVTSPQPQTCWDIAVVLWNFHVLYLFCLGRMPSHVIPYPAAILQLNSNFWRMRCGSCRALAVLQVTEGLGADYR